MKKRIQFISVILACAMGAMSCTGALTERPAETEQGNVRVSIGGLAGERTLLPGVSGLYYTLQFTSGQYSPVNAVIEPESSSVTLSLRQGQWAVTAKGYENEAASSGTPLVTGGQTITVGAPGSAINVTIAVSAAQEGTGSLSYAVTFPNTATIASLGLTDLDGNAVGSSIDLLDSASGTVTLLPSGFYFLTVYLYTPDRKTAQITDLLHIYDNLATAGTWAFTAENFTVPFDRVALYDALNAADDAKLNIQISVDGNDVGDALQWVTEAVMNTFNSAINAAETVYKNKDAAAAAIADEVTALTAETTGAIAVFNDAKQDGLSATTYYTITFNANDGTLEGSSTAQVASGTAVGTLPAATRNGYLLTSWNTAQNGGGEAFTIASTITGNIEVYAQWTAGFTAAATGIANSTVYENLISVSADTYATGYYGDASNVLKTANGANTALTISFTPDFTGTLKLTFAASVMRSTAGKIVWANQSAASTPIFNSDTTSKTANAWHSFSGTDVVLNVTSGTPVTLQLSDGGDNGTFDWYVKDFSLTAKKVVSKDVIVDFEDSPVVYGYGGGTATVETFGDHGKVLRVHIVDYGSKAGGVKINLPDGTTLNDYTVSFKFDAMNTLAGADSGSKTGIFYITNNPTNLSGSTSGNLNMSPGINGNQSSLSKTQSITISSSSFSGAVKGLGSSNDIYFAFGVNVNNNGIHLGVDDIKLTYNGAGGGTDEDYPLYEGQLED
jgi:uncharacterized repeat protein (TIGR02543 family)